MTRELTDEEFVEALRLCRLADAAAEGGQTPAGHYLGKLRDLLAPDQAALDRAAAAQAHRDDLARTVDVVMTRPIAPDWGGEEYDDGRPLYHHAWDSTDETVRLWVGPYAFTGPEPTWAVTVCGPGVNVVMRCTPDEATEWADMVKAAVLDSAHSTPGGEL